MKHLKNQFFSMLFLTATITTFSQVGVGTTSPSGALDVVSTTQGFIMPRATTVERDAMTVGASQTGMQVYDTTTNTVWLYNGTSWVNTGAAGGKFVDGTTSTNAVYTTGNVGIGATNPDASAALDVVSATGGVLIPRVTSAERDAIAAPANALLVFNISNNKFEAYKTSCTCWVTITDGGNTPASNLVNTPPTASSLNYTGTFIAGGTATLVYTYADAQSDAEGATTIEWEIANTNQGVGKTTLGTGNSQAFTVTEAGRFVRAVVTPRAATGILNGIPYFSTWTIIDVATAPNATAVSVTGTVAQGTRLIGAYTFNGGSGTEFVSTADPIDLNDKSVYQWQTATDVLGGGRQTLGVPDDQDKQYAFFTPDGSHLSRYIRFGVRAKDDAGLVGSTYVYSAWVGPITVATEAAPYVEDVTYSPAPGANVVLTASYAYRDVNNDPEGTSAYQWYTATDATGAGQVAITGATSTTYTVPQAIAASNPFIGFGVTPTALTGTTTGTEVVYYNSNAAVAPAAFTFDAVTFASNNFLAGGVLNEENTLTVQIDVTAVGSISFSSNTVDGYSFEGGGSYAVGNDQQVVLTATGIKGVYTAAGDDFTISGVGTTTETQAANILNVRLGSAFTAHFNGITAEVSADNTLVTYTTGETFNNNGIAATKIISASPCLGVTSVTGASGTVYATVEINGQCWFAQNLQELPGGVAVNATEWLGTAPGDQGYYGYYNLVTSDGTAGWAITEPATNEGILYQWTAAMDGSVTERTQGLCPRGWHIPSDTEYMYLEHGLGMSLSQQALAANTARSAGNDSQGTPADKMIDTGIGAGANNTSGFSILMAGVRQIAGAFANRATNEYQGTSSLNNLGVNYFRRQLTRASSGIRRTHTPITNAPGISFRCLKD